jgi:hypothetical protein
MAAAVTKVRAYGIESEEPVNKRYIQRLVLTITQLAADVTMDIGAYAGTFWTAAGGSATGATALQALKDIVTRADACSLVGDISGYARAATAAAGAFSVAMENKTPKVTFNTASAPTTLTFTIEWVLKDAEEPVEVYAAA